MSDWGEDGIEAQAAELPLPTHAFGVDIGSMAGEVVDAAVQASVRKAVSEVATAAVKEALTPELMAALRERAAEAAAAAVTEQVEANEASTAEQVPAAHVDVDASLYYGSVDEFVREYLCNVYRRRIDGQHRLWAARWWQYDEAVIRLEALWRSWERLRLDGALGMSVWWRDHADHHMPALMSPDGPFSTLSPDEMAEYRKGEPLPYEPPPPGLFPDVRESGNQSPDD